MGRCLSSTRGSSAELDTVGNDPPRRTPLGQADGPVSEERRCGSRRGEGRRSREEERSDSETIRVECRHPGVREIRSDAKRGSEEAKSGLTAWGGEEEAESRAERQAGLPVA
ncbi:hypothetical protein NDU88_007997 [Pleurodeles waltl]|uniref:Uncharacterized protein n=1 Tax=Pleurodeles waltl TaxID=8319 RepID=A0AAV7U2V9_PLEWA|nr:hypothetical protein NDU88_007997 [Pleurodeles waltl]